MRAASGVVGAMPWWQQPVVLLLVTGSLIGMNFPLGKLAGQAGVAPLLWAQLISLGASLSLLPWLLRRRELDWPSVRLLRYAVISALVSFVVPNLLLFSVIPHVGAGHAGLMFALSPVFTLLLAGLFRLRTPGCLGRFGILLGLIGAGVVSLGRGGEPLGPEPVWLLAALLIPVALAVGNVYRTLDWPDGAAPNLLAFWGHGFASLLFSVLLWLDRGSLPWAEVAAAGWAVPAQLLVAGLTFPVFFRLQQRGGPVLLSQIGYVAAAVGLVAATLLLGERYAGLTWLGAGVIGLGIGVTVWAQWRELRADERALTPAATPSPAVLQSVRP